MSRKDTDGEAETLERLTRLPRAWLYLLLLALPVGVLVGLLTGMVWAAMVAAVLVMLVLGRYLFPTD